MSAYIVEKKTIDRIVTYIYSQRLQAVQRIYPHIYEVYKGDPQKLGQKLWGINIKAVNQRYNENNAVDIYKYECRIAKDIQVLKTLQCFLYQCAEGDIPKSLLYQDLRNLERNLALEIVYNLPEYKQAEWG